MSEKLSFTSTNEEINNAARDIWCQIFFFILHNQKKKWCALSIHSRYILVNTIKFMANVRKIKLLEFKTFFLVVWKVIFCQPYYLNILLSNVSNDQFYKYILILLHVLPNTNSSFNKAINGLIYTAIKIFPFLFHAF